METSNLSAHVRDVHGFGFEDVGVPLQPELEELHDELHDQEQRSGLPTHQHPWQLVEFHTGERVGPLFDSEALAQAWALEHFGPEAGKEYGPRRIVPST
jgi:hypothetical protein